MKSKWFLTGILSIMLVFGLVLTGCPTDDSGGGANNGDPTLKGTIVISTSSGGAAASSATTGATLYAVYSGTEKVSYQWNKDRAPISSSGTSASYTPATAGSYTVTVSASGYQSKTSAAVTVTSGSNNITYTVTANGSTIVPTTALVFAFSGTVNGLTADDITVTSGTGTAAKGALSGSSLAITVSTGGTITVKIAKSGVESGQKTVTVFKGDEGARLIGQWYDSPAKANTAYGVPYYEFTDDGKILIDSSDQYQVRYSDLNLTTFTVSYSVEGIQVEETATYSINGNRLNISGSAPLSGSYFQGSAPIDISWTAADSPFTEYNAYFTAVTWGGPSGNEKFVAVGDKGRIAYSSDGITWTAVTNSPFTGSYNEIKAVAWGGPSGNEKFVAVGQNKTIAYSADGVSWTLATFSFANTYFRNYIYGVTWGNDRFYAVGDDNGLAYSSDGVTWDGTSSSVFEVYRNGIVRGVAWGGPAGQEKFIAAGNSGSMGYSEDGEDWELTGNWPAYIGEDLYGIIWGGGKFLVFGAAGVLAYSTDGTPENWELAQKTSTSGFRYSLGSQSYISDIAFGGGKFIAVGNDEESGYNNGMLYSEDGINWTEIVDGDMLDDILSSSPDPQSIAYGNGKFVVVFYGNKIAYSN